VIHLWKRIGAKSGEFLVRVIATGIRYHVASFATCLHQLRNCSKEPSRKIRFESECLRNIAETFVARPKRGMRSNEGRGKQMGVHETDASLK
jgi:hypothetical protein